MLRRTLRFMMSLVLSLAFSRAAWAWTEASLDVPECVTCTGQNDMAPGNNTPYPASGVANLNNAGSIYTSGTGYLANSSDVDVYQFHVLSSDINNATCNNMLKVTLTSPSGYYYNMDLNAWNTGCNCWNGNGGGGGNGTQTLYYDLSGMGANQDFYIRIQNYNNSTSSNPYTVTISIVPSAHITGQVKALGASASGSGNIQVSGIDNNGQMYGGANTDGAGNFSLNVPAGVSIVKLQAQRSWYNGAAADWGYGPTSYLLPSAFSGSSCSSSSPYNFNVYPEAVFKGTYSGAVNMPNQWNVNIQDEYNRNQSGGYINSNTSLPAGNFEFHNLMPGTFHVEINPNTSGFAKILMDNKIFTDGLTTTASLSFNAGGSLTVNLSPTAGSGQNVQLYLSGFDHNKVAGASGVTSSYTFNNVPLGVYDVQVGGNGPGTYFTANGITVTSGSQNVTVNGLNLNSSISGSIVDAAGVGPALGLAAVPHGTDPSNGNVPVSFGQVDPGSLTFSVAVDSSYNWDLLLINQQAQNGFPPSYGAMASVAAGASGITLTSVSGYPIQGSVSLGGQLINTMPFLSNFFNNGNGVSIYASGNNIAGGAGINFGGASWSSYPLWNDTYTVNSNIKFLSPVSLSNVVMNSATVTANINYSVDPAQDTFLPFASQLNPVNGQVLTSTSAALSCVLSDDVLGSGIASSPVMKLDGGTVGASFNSSTGLLSYNAGALAQGQTHTVQVNFQDKASPANVTSVAWSFYVAPPAPTATPTFTFTQTPTQQIYTPTITPTPSQTAVVTATPTATASPIYTASNTPTMTSTSTPTQMNTPTPTWTPGGSGLLWTEGGSFGSLNECPTCSGVNDSTPGSTVAYPVPNVVNLNSVGSIYGTGQGYLANSSDVDVYQFRVNGSDISGCNNMLQITLTSPSHNGYSLDIYQWNPGGNNWSYQGGGGGNNGISTRYIDLSTLNPGQTQDFYVRIYSYGSVSSNPYNLSIALVASASISGQVNAVGVGASQNTNIQVNAIGSDGQWYGQTSANAAGMFSGLRVPAGVTITQLRAYRNWYNGAASDWAYGPTVYNLPSAYIGNACGTSSSYNFNVYPEATFRGTYTGTSNAPQNWNINIDDEYLRYGNGNNFMVDNTQSAGNFLIHNMAPGTYHLEIDPNDGSNAKLLMDNVTFTDGLATNKTLSFNAGGSLTVNLVPTATSGQNIQISVSGFSHGNSITNASGVTNSYVFTKLPLGLYDIQVGGNGGPGSYFMAQGVTVASGSQSVNVQGLNLNSSISGYIVDAAGVGSALGLAAVPHGTDPSNGNVPVSFGQVNPGSLTFSVAVDSSYNWDLLLINMNQAQNGFPPTYGAAANQVPGASGLTLTTAVGYPIQGTVNFGAQPIGNFPSLAPFFQNGGDGFSIFMNNNNIVGGGSLNFGASTWSSFPLWNGSYTVRSNQKFLSPVSVNTTLSGTTATANVTYNIDAAQDIYLPFASQLNPVNGQVLGSGSTMPMISCALNDGLLGTGINTSPVMKVDGATVAASFNSSTGVLSYTPSTALATGVSHTVQVNFQDKASTPNSNSVSWSFYIAALPTPTPSSTATPSATQTATPSATSTNTPSPTQTATPSATPSATISSTFTVSPVVSPTPTFSNSPIVSATPTSTVTATPSDTSSYTATVTPSTTPSVTSTASNTPLPTATSTASNTPLPTSTPSNTVTPSDTSTYTPSATPSSTSSVTSTPSSTGTATPSASPSPTASNTPLATATVTPSNTPSGTASASPSITFTGSPSFSNTPSATLSLTPTYTFSNTGTPSATPFYSSTPTATPTFSPIAVSTSLVPGNVSYTVQVTTAQGVQFNIPGNCFASAVTLTVITYGPSAAPAGSFQVGGITGLVSNIFSIDVGGNTLQSSVTLSLPYDPTQLGSNSPSQLTITYYNGSAWVSVASTVDSLNHLVTATVTHFSLWAVGVTAPSSQAAYAGANPPARLSSFVYPQPVKASAGTAKVAYNMASSGQVTIQVFNEMGQKVDQVDESKPAGVQTSSLTVGNYAAGVYFYSLVIHYDNGSVDRVSLQGFTVVR